MFDKNSLYVSAIRYYNQLKLDYKQLSNNNIVKAEQSSFLINENILSQDAIYKLKALEQNESQTYISTLCDCIEQKIVSKVSKNDDSYKTVNLNSEFNISLEKSALFETKYFFETCGIDYIYSPFHVLNLHCEQNPSSNSLVGLVLNNYLYMLILNGHNQIVYSKIETLTSFEEIQKSDFYENEISGQKLFDEIYYFEIENIINTVLKEYYETGNSNSFIDKVTILHMIKQLSEEQINRLHEELLIEVNYHSISLDDYIYELAKQAPKEQKSFIKPRKKEKSKFLFYTLTILSLLITFSAFYFYNYITQKKVTTQNEIKVESQKLKQEEEKQNMVPVKYELPNHIQQNNNVKNQFLSIFETIPYSVVLEELELNETTSTLKIFLLENDVYIKDIQPKLSKYYKISNINFENSQISKALKATIQNSEPKLNVTESIALPNYTSNGFLPKLQIEGIINPILGQNAVAIFKEDKKGEISVFSYTVTLIHKEPKEFFEIIDKLNKELYSINIVYPVKMKKLPQGLETTFTLQFNQNN